SSSARPTCRTRSPSPPTRKWTTVWATPARCAACCRPERTRRSITRRWRPPRTRNLAATSTRSAARCKRARISRSRRESAFFWLAAQQPLFRGKQALGLAEQHDDIARLQRPGLGRRQSRAGAGPAHRTHLHAVERGGHVRELAADGISLGFQR